MSDPKQAQAQTEQTQQAKADSLSPPPAQSQTSSKKRVLVVEDEQNLKNMYIEILKAGGIDADGADDGVDCLAKLEKEKDKYDVVLLDLMMPNMDGLEALEKIKADPGKYGLMPVLILTNLASDAVIKEGFGRKADGYLIKSELSPEQIVGEVKKYLGV